MTGLQASGSIDGHRLDFTAEAGQLVNLVGPPRWRQRTLAVLAGQESMDNGRISFKDQDIRELRQDPRVSFAPQQTRIIEALTAAENVALPLLAARADRGQALTRAGELLTRLAVAEPMHHNLAGQLSGGQRQRVCVARALITRPLLLIADDPASELDAASAEVVADCLRELQADGTIVVLGTGELVTEESLVLSANSLTALS